jgi:hypothetical protein
MLAGAVYNPLDEIVPTGAFRDQVTAVLVDPDTAAINCRVCPAITVAAAGDNTIVTVGTSVITALAVLVRSARLVAVMLTV